MVVINQCNDWKASESHSSHPFIHLCIHRFTHCLILIIRVARGQEPILVYTAVRETAWLLPTSYSNIIFKVNLLKSKKRKWRVLLLSFDEWKHLLKVLFGLWAILSENWRRHLSSTIFKSFYVMASLREHIKNNTSAFGLHLEAAHQVNLVPFLTASGVQERTWHAIIVSKEEQVTGRIVHTAGPSLTDFEPNMTIWSSDFCIFH